MTATATRPLRQRADVGEALFGAALVLLLILSEVFSSNIQSTLPGLSHLARLGLTGGALVLLLAKCVLWTRYDSRAQMALAAAAIGYSGFAAWYGDDVWFLLTVLAGYGGSRRLLRVCLVFFTVSAAFGGGILALQLLGNRSLTLANGVLSSPLDLKLVLLSAAGCYGLITLLFQRAARHSSRRELAPAVVELGGRRAVLTALVDTGNTLTDPATGRPVLVAEGEKVKDLFPPGTAPSRAELYDPAGAMERLSGAGLRCRLLPYQAVGVECALLLALRSDRVTVGGEDCGPLLVALSPTGLTDGGGYCALIGA